MGKFVRIALTVVLTAALLLGGTGGVILYRTRYAKTEVTRDRSPDGRYTLTVYMVGEPVFPFGPARCRFELSEGRRKIVRYGFDVYGDGGPAVEDDFTILWSEDCATVTVAAEEQQDAVYVLSFDGTVTERSAGFGKE